MPNFDIRKELQIRYQVDRRHIYDYFHSRGRLFFNYFLHPTRMFPTRSSCRERGSSQQSY
ncbi:hypothetical protein DFJ43DRAFT_987364 [Lentinula guzmanii]|uniref:Uncharacterized protein n=1 Tax=Lentinula guzmanii TaxID=2804957 RepID=A0AA38JXX5_9AGAR|nr:hypothetical protein DFJ43DRAFT_987364 [Lentinula guzmanii]